MALPSLKDFKGVSAKAFDGAGNYTLGITEQTIFPEMEYDKIQKVHGMDIVMVIKSRSKEESHQLLKLIGLPFKT